jgi:hypothetical protein
MEANIQHTYRALFSLLVSLPLILNNRHYIPAQTETIAPAKHIAILPQVAIANSCNKEKAVLQYVLLMQIVASAKRRRG